jgi:hypothetical protein
MTNVPYREAAGSKQVLVETIDLWLPEHEVTTGLCAIFGGLLFIPFFSGLMALGGLEAWLFVFPGLGAFLIAIALRLRARRRRPMRIVREGHAVKLIVEGGPELTLPIEQTGMQITVAVRNAENWRLFLRLSAARGGVLLLEEGRGTLHGEQKDWLGGVTDPSPRADYKVKANTLARIRSTIDQLNEEHRG